MFRLKPVFLSPARLRAIRTISNASFSLELGGTKHCVEPLWLRLKDPKTITPNGQRTIEISDIVETTVVSSTMSEQDGLRVQWDDGSMSHFPSEWLRQHLEDVNDADAARSPPSCSQYLWNANFRHHVPEVNYTDLSNGAGRLRMSSALTTYGIALIRGVPCEPGAVLDVGNSIGFVRNTNYGELFDVIDLGTAGNNLAQTNAHIRAHTDNPYRDPFPGVQLLHCLANATAGGATSFADGFAAAEALRANYPESFAMLAHHRHPFEYRDPTEGVLLRSDMPVLTVGPGGRVERVCFNNRSAGVIGLAGRSLVEYYRAWARFDALCNSEAASLKLQLQPGDLAIFLNSRVMHGREAYTPGAGRHIQGCYIDHDAVRSRVDWAGNEGRGITGSGGGEGIDVHAEATDRTLAALATQATFSYGEGLDMLQHALQAAHIAVLAEEPRDAVLAALMHDVGNAPQARDTWEAAGRGTTELLRSPSDGSIGYRHHAAIGALFLGGQGFAENVCNAVGLHVSAKRALVGMDRSYLTELSQASIDTLKQQGGPMVESELAEFHGTLGSDIALRLRRYDDQGKNSGPSSAVPQLESYRKLMYDHLKERSLA